MLPGVSGPSNKGEKNYMSPSAGGLEELPKLGDVTWLNAY